MTKVIEIGGYAAGYAGRLLQRAGADVVRVESTTVPPAWVSDQAMSLYLHAGKRRVQGLTIDARTELIGAADLVICEVNSAAEYEALSGLDGDQTVAVISPFGLTGPKRNWRATPSTLLAMGGYTYLMGDAGRTPLSLPGHYLEFQAGTLAAGALHAALYAKGQGELIEISMFETLMSLSQFTTVRWHCAGDIRSRHGSDFWFVSPSDLFKCQDGWVYINIVPNFWDAFLVFIDVPELVVDARFATNDGRMLHRDDLLASIGERFLTLTKAEIEQRAVDCRVPVGVVRTMDDVLTEPHLKERDSWESITSVSGQTVKSPRLPYRIVGAQSEAFSLQEVSDEL